MDPTSYLLSDGRSDSPGVTYQEISDPERNALISNEQEILSNLFSNRSDIPNDELFENTSTNASGASSSRKTNTRVYNPNIENDMTSDYSVVVAYDSVPNVCEMLTKRVWNQCQTISEEFCTVENIYSVLYSTVSAFPTVNSVKEFPSVVTFLLQARPLRASPAKTLDYWTRTVLPSLTVHHDVQLVDNMLFEQIDLALPCRVLFITTNVYCFVFFDRIYRRLGSAGYDTTVPVKLIGGVIVSGAAV